MFSIFDVSLINLLVSGNLVFKKVDFEFLFDKINLEFCFIVFEEKYDLKNYCIFK